jgi:hypothetical protein
VYGYGPRAVEVEPGARLALYRCPLKSCGGKKLYLIQGTSGAIPPRCWANVTNNTNHRTSQVMVEESTETVEVPT